MNNHPQPLIYWKNLRIMAYIALSYIPFVLILTALNKIDPNSTVAEVSLWISGLIVLGYYGANSVEIIGKMNK